MARIECTANSMTIDFSIVSYRNYLEDWLYTICLNNIENELFCEHIKEIISRLDGFEKYVEYRESKQWSTEE